MARRGTLTVRALLDAKEFAKGLDDMGSKLERRGRKLKDFGKSMSRNVSLPLAAGAVAAVKFASDQNEALSKVNVTFRRNGREVERWADNSAQAMGQSKAEALEAAGGFGAMLQAMGLAERPAADMSMALVELAGDMASFNNASPEEMLTNLRSALAGEVEPLRKFGVNVSAAAVTTKALEMGLADASGEISEAAKVQARYALIMEQTSKQQGDFARTSGEVANQTRIAAAEAKDAAAEFGTQLLPIAKDLLRTGTGLVKAFGAMPGPMKNVAAGAGLLAIAAGPVIRGFGSMAELGGKFIGRLRVLDKTTGTTQISLAKFGKMLGRAGLIGLGLIVATQLLGKWIERKQKATEAAADYAAALEADAGALEDNTRQTVINRLAQDDLFTAAERLGIKKADLVKAVLDPESEAHERVTQALKDSGSILDTLTFGSLTDHERARRALEDALGREDDALRTQIERYEQAIETERELAEATRGAATATDGWSQQIEDMRPIMDGWQSRAEDMADQLDDTGDEADKTTVKFHGLTESIERQQQALREQTDPVFRAQQSLQRLQGAQDDLNEAVKEHGPKSDEARDAQRRLAEQAFATQADLLDLRRGVEEGTISVENYERQLDSLVKNGFITRAEAEQQMREFRDIKETAESIDGVDPHVEIRSNYQDAIRRLREVRNMANQIPRRIGVSVGVTGSVVPRQHGGPVKRGHPYLVGEKGAELFVPPQSGRIEPHAPSHARAMGGGGMSVNVHMPNYLGSKEEVAEVIRREIVKVQRRNGSSGIV